MTLLNDIYCEKNEELLYFESSYYLLCRYEFAYSLQVYSRSINKKHIKITRTQYYNFLTNSFLTEQATAVIYAII